MYLNLTLIEQEPEMKINDMLPSSYLKQSDFTEAGLIVTITGIEHKNVAIPDEPEKMKYILNFAEFDKGMVLNSTNINACAKACGSEDTDDWTGKEVIVYVDPNVGFAGKQTGGLRIKRYAQPTAPTAPARRQPVMDNAPPF